MEFLDSLMRNGQMSSFSASQMMMHKFPTLSFDQVNTIITYWIYSYEERSQS